MKKTNFSNIVKKIDDVESYRKDLKKVLINLKDISTRNIINVLFVVQETSKTILNIFILLIKNV